MFRLINVSVDHSRLRLSPRTRTVGNGRSVLFSWGAVNDRADAVQSACRVTLSAHCFSWDSGWINTRAQELRYEGPELPRGEAVSLTIRVKDDSGLESETYSNAIYNAALDWNSGWIGMPRESPSHALYFRREFEITRPVRFAALYVCGLGYQHITVNGTSPDNAKLDPAYTDYTRTCQYVFQPEIGSLLRPGKNCIGVTVGSGWRHVRFFETRKMFGGKPLHFQGSPQLSAILHITYEDGSSEKIVTDSAWQCGSGPVTDNDLFDGETYDAREAHPGWDMPGFSGFASAEELPTPGGVMRPMLVSPIIEHNSRRPVAIWSSGDSAIIDFGQNIAGVVRVHLPAGLKRGDTVTVSTAEELDEQGELETAPLRTAKSTDTYIASGDPRELAVWQPSFTYHGFRYASLTGLGPGITPETAEAVEWHTDLETHSFFRCGNPIATEIHKMCLATERANQHSVLTDCPQRDERQGWMNDATVRFEETPYNFDIGIMFPKLIRDIMDAQGTDGSITCTAPFVFGSRPADPVCSSFILAGWEAWLHTGNTDILREAFPAFEAWENCLLSHSDGYIVNYGYYGDWAAPAYACKPGDSAESAVTPVEFMSTGYSFLNCRLLSRIADLLNLPDSKKHWEDVGEKVRTAMLDKWYDSKSGAVCTGSQACQAFSLWLGILPESGRPAAAQRLSDDLTANGLRFTTGNLCTRYLLDVLSDSGRLDTAWALVTKQDYPSWGYMLQNEATTVWERFELKKNPGMNSHNHPMYGALDYWFYAYLTGIRPVDAGWSRIVIKPYMPRGLLSAQAVVDTVKGDVAVRWFRRYGGTYLHVTVPFGSRAEIFFGGETHEVGSGFHVFSFTGE